MNKVAIIGAGDLGQTIAHLVQLDKNIDVFGFFDDTILPGTYINKIPVVGKIDDIQDSYRSMKFNRLVMAIGYKNINFRKKIFERFKSDIPFHSIIHESVILDPSTIIGSGVVIMAGCVIDKSVEIRDNVLLNIGVSIAHDSIIESHSFLGPNVCVAGFSKISELCFIGINTTIINNITLCKGTRTAGGSVMTESNTKSGLYAGIPAKFKKP